MFDDSALCLRIYENIVRTSEVPKVAKLAADFEVAIEDIRVAPSPMLGLGGDFWKLN